MNDRRLPDPIPEHLLVATPEPQPVEPSPPAEPPSTGLVIVGDWLLEETGRHTCGAGGEHGHEPSCGLEPVMSVTELDALLRREGGSDSLPPEGTRTVQGWTPGGRDEREDVTALVTADDGLQLVLGWDGDLEHPDPDEVVAFDRPGDLLDLAIIAADGAALQLAGSNTNGLHLAEGITGDELERRLASLEAAVARLRYRLPVWASGERAARAAAVSSDPWRTPGTVDALPPF